ncbi:hypothetical protein JTE90_003558 [Oedothorax gibbosus]|uniref:Uncharacterized protein n=1 Tax=Oedothorax gibbosus TaxID=931172 RepID=A0AAV6VLX3_9ARAC|nr:hypothetical protein JTE90_003558 [Oedothorax gibbosus]
MRPSTPKRRTLKPWKIFLILLLLEQQDPRRLRCVQRGVKWFTLGEAALVDRLEISLAVLDRASKTLNGYKSQDAYCYENIANKNENVKLVSYRVFGNNFDTLDASPNDLKSEVDSKQENLQFIT